MELLGGRPPSGPNDARNLERLLGMLDGLDLDAGTTMNILGTLVTYVMGVAIREVQEMRGQRDRELAEADLTADELQAEQERFRKWFESSGRYPRIARLMEAGIDPDDPETRDSRFEFGLDCVLDGIATRIQSSG